jgi:formiminotetrahydrofolate cyclodeaminase
MVQPSPAGTILRAGDSALMTGALDLPLSEFTRQLAAEQPTPGGGSAAALVGATGAALVSMVCRYTIGRERYRSSEDRANQLLDEAERLRSALEQDVEADVEAYQGYAEAQRLPRDTDEQKAARDEARQRALIASTEVPLGVAERSSQVVRLACDASAIGNPYLISDAGVAASLGLAAFESAALNVELNASGLEDAAFASSVLERLRLAGTIDELRAVATATYGTIRRRTS